MSACPEIIDLLPCPECGGPCELVPGPADGWEFKRCRACGWSRLFKVATIDEEWCDLGAYVVPRSPFWAPYVPNDPRLKGLATWELPKPAKHTEALTIDFQRQFLLDVLGYMVPTLLALTTLYQDDPYVINKLHKIAVRHQTLSDKVLPFRKITRIQEASMQRRAAVYLLLMDSFTPRGFREQGKTREDLEPYAWGYSGMLYFFWMTLYRDLGNLDDAIGECKGRRLMREMMQSMEALCVRLQSESAIWELDQKATAKCQRFKRDQIESIHRKHKAQKKKR